MKKFYMPLSCELIAVMLCSSLMGCANEKGANSGKASEPVELIWLMGGAAPTDQAKVEAKLNEISVKKLGVKMKTIYYEQDDALKLALTSGEKWDIAFTCEWFNNYAVQAFAGYFADITDKVKTLTPALYDTMPAVVWEGAKVNNKIYAVPTKKDYCNETYFCFDIKLFEDALGMTIPATMNYADVEPFLAAAKQAWKDGAPEAANAEYPYKFAKNSVYIEMGYDRINSDVSLGLPYSAIGTADANKVMFAYEDPNIVAYLKTIRSFYEKGYINPDAPTIEQLEPYSAVKTAGAFYGAEGVLSSMWFPLKMSKLWGPYLTTSQLRGSLNAINVKSENIDLALKYLELVNTDKEYRDILRYGIEGVHWNKAGDNLVERTTVGVQNYNPWPFSQGSYSLSSVEKTEGVDADPHMWDVVFKGYEKAVATSALGFSFDVTPVEAQVAACAAVNKKYMYSLGCGAVDVDSTIAALIAEMEAAGLRDVQAECQRQLDAYIAGK